MTEAPTLGEFFGERSHRCDCCGSDGVPLKVFRSARLNSDGYNALCGLCSGTMIGLWSEYPNQHNGDKLDVMKMIAVVGNEILKALKQLKR